MVVLIVAGALGTVPKVLKKDKRKWKSEEELRPPRLHHWITGDLRRLTIIQTPEKTNIYHWCEKLT